MAENDMTTKTIDLTPGVEEQKNLLRYFAHAFVEKSFVDWSYGPMASLLDLARCVYVNAGPEEYQRIIDEFQRRAEKVERKHDGLR